MKIKHDLDDPGVIGRIQTVLQPREFTKLDEIVELVFHAAEDVKKEVELNETGEEVGGGAGDDPGVKPPKFTPVNFREACAASLVKEWQIPLIKRTFAHFSSADESIGAFCLNSREHERSGQPSYWFALHPHQVEALRRHTKAYLVLGCGSVDNMILIPLSELEKWLPSMWKTTREARTYWHIVVNDRGGPKLSLTSPLEPIDLGEFLWK